MLTKLGNEWIGCRVDGQHTCDVPAAGRRVGTSVLLTRRVFAAALLSVSDCALGLCDRLANGLPDLHIHLPRLPSTRRGILSASFRQCNFCRCARSASLQNSLNLDNETHHIGGNASLTHRGPSNSSVDLEDRSHSSLHIELGTLQRNLHLQERNELWWWFKLHIYLPGRNLYLQ